MIMVQEIVGHSLVHYQSPRKPQYFAHYSARRYFAANGYLP
jgi:hypothetical protein